jgi:Carboxypeptidase regulatory-like domain/TonB dependent receptor
MEKRITFFVFVFVFAVLLSVLPACPAWAQIGTSEITGVVTDASGAVVANAKVEAKNEDTGAVFNQNTTSSGNYSFPSLVPGRYSITVTVPGFQTFTSLHNVLTIGAPLVVDVALKLTTVGQTVEVVESNYQRLETSNATVSDIMDTKQVQNLPLNGRNPLSLLTLEPGVVQRTFGGAGSGTHVFGSRDRSHNVTIDGIDANESTVPNPQSNIQRLNPDNVQEFRTVTLGATAEEGRNSGANVMVASKSGGNGVHGSVYYFNRNTVYNANEFFNNATGQPRPDLKLNQYGFDVGGPIIKNKTFFFGSFQNNSIKQSAPISSALATTPLVYTSAMRSGNYRFVRGTVTANGKSFSRNDQQLVDASGNLLPGIPTCSAANKLENCVDSYNIFAHDPAGIGPDPATFAFIKSLPLPNTFSGVGSACSSCIAPADGLNNAGFSWNPPTEFSGPHYMVRVDHTFGPNDSIFVRWLQNHFNTTKGDFINARPQVYPGFPPLGEVNRLGKNLAISYRHTFSPNLVNEFTAGFNRFAFNFTFGESNPNFGDPSKVPPWTDNCLLGATIPDSFQNISSPLCVSPHTQRAVTTPQFVDNISWIHGAHTLRAGINFRFYIHNDSRGFFGNNALVPVVSFDGSNRPSGFTAIPGQIGSDKATAPNSQDIARLQQAIVEVAGIPYSISQSYYANFNANTYGSPLAAVVYTRAHQYDSYVQDEWKVRPNLTLNLGIRWEYNPAPYDAKQTLVPNVLPDGLHGTVSYVKAGSWFKNDNLTAVGPRIGVAWAPDKKTSVRAGYAWLFDTLSTFQVTAIAGKMPGFLLGCVTTNDGSGNVGTTSGCATPAGTANRISQGYPLKIGAPTTTPSAALTVPAQPGSTAPGVGAFDPNLKNPSVHEWSLTIQRELPLHFVTEVGYIGKRGTHLYRAYDLNQGSIGQPGFLDSFKIARANALAGCNGDGTGCPAGVVGQSPTLLLQLVSPSFINSTSSKTDLQRGNIGNFATRMDNLAPTVTCPPTPTNPPCVPSPRRALPFNYVRPNAQFGQIFFQDSGGDSYYHGLFVSARRRFEQGLDVSFSYTFSKSIDDMSVDPTGASTGGGLSSTSFSRTPTDIHNFRLDRALSDFNNTHVVLASLLYDFPIGKTKKFAATAPRWVNLIIGGWSLTGLFIYQSGEPYTISSGARTENAAHNSTALIVGPNIRGGDLQFPSGTIGPVMYQTGGFITAPLNDPHLNCQNVNGTQTYFCIPPPGQNGSGRNTALGPNYWNLDSGLLKNFDLTERFKLQFRGEVFNVLNHPNFENPRNATVGSPTVTSPVFGQTCCATAAVASAQQVNPVGEPMRVIQLGLKLNF